jgi:hypothetical protein
MLKAIVTVTDENDKILQANRLIFENDSKPVDFGIRHDFYFSVVTADEDFMHKLYEACGIKEELEGGIE